MAAPQRGGGASGRGRYHREGRATQKGWSCAEGAEPQGRAVPQRGRSHGAVETQKELQEQIADPEQDADGLGGQWSKSAGQIRATACPTTEMRLGALGKA